MCGDGAQLLLCNKLSFASISLTASHRYPGENGYVDANSITFPWVVNKKDIPPDEVQGLDEFVQGKYGGKS